MSVVIYKVTRQGGMGLSFEAKDGTRFFDPNGLRNPQLARIAGNKLMTYVRCNIDRGVAEVLGEASEDEVAAYEGRDMPEEQSDEEPEGPFKFPAR